MEFSNKKQFDKYMKLHPNANPQNHTIRKQDYDKKTEESEKIAKTKPCVENLNLLICTNADKMKSHKDYKEAKKGDMQSAFRLVHDVIKKERMERIRKFVTRDDIIIPVFAEEMSGRNKIQFALAQYIADETGCELKKDIWQINRANHTGATKIERILKPAYFAGHVVENGRYIIVDDHTTSGSTLSKLATYIEHYGGTIKGCISLSMSSKIKQDDNGIYRLSPTKEQLDIARKKFGDVLKEECDIELHSLTYVELKYLNTFKSKETLIKKIKETKEKMTANNYILTYEEFLILSEDMDKEYERWYFKRLENIW